MRPRGRLAGDQRRRPWVCYVAPDDTDHGAAKLPGVTDPENSAVGLYYYRARYYDPGRGRFVNEDPIGLRGGMNLFAYVRNDPVNRVDPSGKWAHLLAELLVETLENAFPHKVNEGEDEMLEALRREKEITDSTRWWKERADYMECLNRTLNPGKCRNLRPDDLNEPTNGCRQ